MGEREGVVRGRVKRVCWTGILMRNGGSHREVVRSSVFSGMNEVV